MLSALILSTESILEAMDIEKAVYYNKIGSHLSSYRSPFSEV